MGCRRYREPDTEDRLEKIQQKIDHSQFDESIQELQEILKQEPENDRARVILGSAYVRKAGIAIKDYFFLATLFSEEVPVSEPLIDIQVLQKLTGEQATQTKGFKDFIDKVNQTAASGEQIAKKFDAIAVVTPEAARELQTGLNEMEKLKNPTDGMLFYRGVIKLYYFKFLWVNKKLLPVGDGKLCSLRISEIMQKLRVIDDYSVRMILDISKGFPKMSKDFLSKAQEIDSKIIEAQSFLSGYTRANPSLKQIVSAKLKELDVRNFVCDF